MEWLKLHWKWVMLGVIVVAIVTGVWNEIAGVPHVR